MIKPPRLRGAICSWLFDGCHRQFLSFVVFLLLTTLCPAASDGQTLPQAGDRVHLGVLTCGGSTCHDALQPWQNSAVPQNEAVVWRRDSRHSKAYESLTGERSLRIARNLGIGDPTSAKVCLDCHADNVPADKRSRQFRLSDGVGCEACHGGAELWLGRHVSGASTHADSIEAGMYPTEEPASRAKLCLSCHLGTKDAFVTHRILGAGHPRLVFELDTFTAGPGAHHRVDADYIQRKPNTSGAKTWVIGQLTAVRETLAALAGPGRNRPGGFPELAFFNCYDCHRPLATAGGSSKMRRPGTDAGLPHLSDANIIMLRIIARVLAPDLVDGLVQWTRELHRASRIGTEAIAREAEALVLITDGIDKSLTETEILPWQIPLLFDGILAEGLAGTYATYMDAEQSTMALGAVLIAIKQDGSLGDRAMDRLNKALQNVYAATSNDERFDRHEYVAALKSLKTSWIVELENNDAAFRR